VRGDEAGRSPLDGLLRDAKEKAVHLAHTAPPHRMSEGRDQRRVADLRQAVRVILEDDRRGRVQRSSEQPGLQRETQTIDVHDIRMHASERAMKRPRRHPRPPSSIFSGAAKNVLDPVSSDSRVPHELLDDRHTVGACAGERLAPPRHRGIAFEQRFRIGEAVVEAVVELSDMHERWCPVLDFLEPDALPKKVLAVRAVDVEQLRAIGVAGRACRSRVARLPGDEEDVRAHLVELFNAHFPYPE
jgi:hypothetical protein